jgi:predicted nucleic-acid-binding Zn-ribbon protein
MARPKRDDVIPSKCEKCGSEQLEHWEFSMHGKLGFLGPDYRFDVYVCEGCSYSEFFFQSAKWLM